MKLRTKIQLFSSLFILVLMLLINTSIYFLFYKISADSELAELSAQTNEMVKTINHNPEIAKKELLGAYLPTDGMIRIIPKNEEPLLIVKKPIDHGNLPTVFYNKEMQTVTENEVDINVAVIAKPIIWENGEVVTLQVSKQLLALQETMTTLFYVLLVASVFMLIPTIIAGRILSQFLLKPINALIQTMKENTRHEKWEKINIQGSSRDELYEMEKTFNDMIDHLKANFKRQEVFVSDASHELKTPISIVKSYAQLLDRRGQENPALFTESVQAIDSEADRMQTLVEQMLLLAKNQVETTMQKVDFSALCEETVATFKGVHTREIIFEAPTEPIFVNGNADQLQQIVYILLDNALKYSEQEIKITLSVQDSQAILGVTDHGRGIPEEEQSLIFDRFYRIDKARSRETGGTGLGLAIAKTIAEAHEGDLFVRSKVGEGTTFSLNLPIVKES